MTTGHEARCDGGYAVVERGDFATALDRLSNVDFGMIPGEAGREHVLERHSAARLVRDMDALYRELLAAKKAA